MHQQFDRHFHSYRWIALLALTVAAWSGVLMRFGFIRGFPEWASNYMAVRHAHSHLMYFGWVTLGLMALIWAYLPRYTGRPRPRFAGLQMAATATVALLSFPAFWANGYGLTAVGPYELPLGSMAASFNGLTWYAFIVLYVQATRRLAVRPLPVRLWDAALGLMALSTVGAIGLATLVATGSGSIALYQLFLHLFLDLFAAGWFTLGLLGVLWAGVKQDFVAQMRLPAGALALALTPTFILGMSPAVVQPAMFWVAALANVTAGVLLARHLWALWRAPELRSSVHRPALLALAVNIAVAVMLLWPGVWRWTNGTQLRVFYLHNLLLGWVSSGLLAVMLIEHAASTASVMRTRLAQSIKILWVVGVGLMLSALLGLGLVALLPLPALFLLRLAAWSSVLPATAALLAWAAALPGKGAATPSRDDTPSWSSTAQAELR